MGLTGDTKALQAFAKKISKLEGATRVVAEKASPKISALVTASFGAQSSPYGAGWVPTKSGAPAFGGGNALGRVLVRLVGKATIRTSVLYPLHFHNAGTHKIGRKRGAVIRRQFIGAGLKGIKGPSAPRQRKGESDQAFQERVQRWEALRAEVKTYRDLARKRMNPAARAAEVQAREAGGMHDPARPMIPDEAEGIPKPWETAIRQAAHEAMGRDLVTERR